LDKALEAHPLDGKEPCLSDGEEGREKHAEEEEKEE
jgi:hypothetical protein